MRGDRSLCSPGGATPPSGRCSAKNSLSTSKAVTGVCAYTRRVATSVTMAGVPTSSDAFTLNIYCTYIHCMYGLHKHSNQERSMSRSLSFYIYAHPMIYPRHSDHEKVVPRSLPAPPLAARAHVMPCSLPAPPSAAPHSCSKLVEDKALRVRDSTMLEDIGEASSGCASSSGAQSFRQSRIVSEHHAGAPDAGEQPPGGVLQGASGRNHVTWPELLLRCREPRADISRDEIEQEVPALEWPELVATSSSEISSPEISSLERCASSADAVVATAETMVAGAEAKAETQMEVSMEAAHRVRHAQVEAAGLSHMAAAAEVSEGEGEGEGAGEGEGEIGRQYGDTVLVC